MINNRSCTQVLLQHGLASRKMERSEVMDGLVELIGMQKEVVIIIIIATVIIINIALNIIMQKEVVIILFKIRMVYSYL